MFSRNNASVCQYNAIALPVISLHEWIRLFGDEWDEILRRSLSTPKETVVARRHSPGFAGMPTDGRTDCNNAAESAVDRGNAGVFSPFHRVLVGIVIA